MPLQEDWVRMTLRMPAELHQQIVERAGNLSVNAQIVELLQQALAVNETARGFRFLDAIDEDPVSRARVIARFHLAAATNLQATDVVFLDPELTERIAAVSGASKVHDAARAAMENAFPAQGITWGQIAEALSADNLSGPENAVREAIVQRLNATPTMAGTVAL